MNRERRTAAERFGLPHPRDVDGYQEAAARGQLPTVPDRPPSQIPDALRPSSAHLLRLLWLRLAVSTGLVLVIVFVVSPGLPSMIGALLALGSGLAWFALLLRWLRQLGRRNLEEVTAGYTTLVIKFGIFEQSSDRRWQALEAGMPWDYSGVWVLDHNLEIQSSPSREVDAPGYYPSPHRAGAWELWTGAVWSGSYRDGPVSKR